MIYSSNLNMTADEIYKIESGEEEVEQNYGEDAIRWTAKIQAAVGLMYVSDYYYSYASSGTDSSKTNCNDSSTSKCKNSWLYISNNGKSDDYQFEWTMTSRGRDKDDVYGAWDVNSAGVMHLYRLDADILARPVFYLDTSISISSGNGGSESPFIIEK